MQIYCVKRKIVKSKQCWLDDELHYWTTVSGFEYPPKTNLVWNCNCFSSSSTWLDNRITVSKWQKKQHFTIKFSCRNKNKVFTVSVKFQFVWISGFHLCCAQSVTGEQNKSEENFTAVCLLRNKVPVTNWVDFTQKDRVPFFQFLFISVFSLWRWK